MSDSRPKYTCANCHRAGVGDVLPAGLEGEDGVSLQPGPYPPYGWVTVRSAGGERAFCSEDCEDEFLRETV